jgi:aryl-alcohol dehydrogenase-like predicted oxidoreductase
MEATFWQHRRKSLSEVGLGCWQLGGGEWGEVSDDLAMGILDAAVDWRDVFDTADVYGGDAARLDRALSEGKSKGHLRRDEALAECRISILTNTRPGESAAVDASLARLRVEAIDLIQLHCVPYEVMRRGEIFEWLRALRKEGKIKSFGASVESMDEALLCTAQPGLASLQIIFNILRQKPIQALFPDSKEKGIAIIVRLPLASGLLSGKFRKDTKFGPKDHRNFNRNGQLFNVGETFAGIPFERGVELAKR